MNRTQSSHDIERQPPKRRPTSEPEVGRVILPSSKSIGKLYFSDIQFHGGSKRKTSMSPGYWTFLAAFLDALVLIALSCFFLVLTALIFQTGVKGLFRSTAEAFTIVFLLLNVIYLVCTRYYFSATLGESVCSLRLGQPSQRFKESYIVKVFLRTLLVYTTGFFILPILSLIFKRDFAGAIVQLKLYRL